MHELAYQFVSNLKATWHYRWYAVALAWIFALFGWVAVYRMPDQYEASARVWVDTKTVLKNFLAGLTAQPNVNEVVGVISRTLISRPNLEKVIRTAGMDIELKTPVELEQLITRLTRELVIRSAGGDLYTITYTNKNPQQAKRVVQSLLTIFVEGSLSDQREDSDTARRFIDEQIKVAKEKLDAAENAVIEFKRQQLLMAGGRGEYMRLLDAQTALADATLELKLAESSRDAIKKNQADEMEIPSLLGDNSTRTAGGDPEIDARVRALEQKLDGLRLNYTEQHPDIAAIVRTIAQLKEQAKAEAEQRRPSPRAAQPLDPGYRPLTLSLATAEAHVAAAKARVDEYRKRYDELKAAAIAAPQIEADSSNLTREYDLAKGTYGALLARRETARMSGEMEKGVGVTNFRVIDPPRVPSLPNAPNRPQLNSIVLLMALAGGIGFAYVLSQIRPTFNDERRLQEVCGVKVLATVIMVWTDAQKAARTRALVALMISFVSLLSAYAAIMVGLVLTASRA